MKVRYTLPVQGALRKQTNYPLTFQQMTFRFEVAEDTGFVKTLVVEILNIPKENWPTLTQVEQDPAASIPRFPFERNEDSIYFPQMEPYLRNLESYLALFGLERFGFDRLREEWIAEPTDDEVSMEQGFALDWKRAEGVFDPVSDDTLLCCIVASGASEQETLFLAYFRLAQMHLSNRWYIEAIRYSYLCIESLFANGKHKSAAVRKLLSQSDELTNVVSKILYQDKHIHFERIRAKYKSLWDAAEPADFIKVLVQLAGKLRHANMHPNLMWHPSRQEDFESEAACIFDVVEQICRDRVRDTLNRIARGKHVS